MEQDAVIPELKQIIGALIFASRHPLTAPEIKRVLSGTAQATGGYTAPFGSVKEEEIRAAIDQIKADLENAKSGLRLGHVADGYRIQSDPSCGPWARHMLNMDKPHRLSRPALETLAIIAYRQPLTRAEIETIRGVNIDHIVRALMELELVRIVGRSEVPGRPMLYGTTKQFLEHFGLQNLETLPGIEQLARIDRNRQAAPQAQTESPAEETAGTSEADANEAPEGQAEESPEQETGDTGDQETVDTGDQGTGENTDADTEQPADKIES